MKRIDRQYMAAVVGLALITSAMGCIPALQNRVPGNAIPATKLASMPPHVLIYVLDASSDRTIETGSTSEINDEVTSQVATIVTANGGHVLQREALVGCGIPCAQFFRWGGLASLEIGLQKEQIRNFGFHSVGAWGFPRPIAPIRTALDADFALFVVLKQTRETSGRKVLLALGGGHTVGKQIDVACIADLHDGRMSWCASKRDDGNDIGEPGRLYPVLQGLLQEVLRAPTPAYQGSPVPQSAASPAPPSDDGP